MGHRLQFASKPPPFCGVVFSVARGESALVLENEISSLLSKGAIRVVPERERLSGCYSQYFPRSKERGGDYLLLDLRGLNRHLRRYTFRMLTHDMVANSVRLDDWFTTVNLRDAYFHYAYFLLTGNFLRFAFRGVAYEYLTIPFGLSLAPRVFTKCVEAALQRI